jgi:hypothetical protein
MERFDTSPICHPLQSVSKGLIPAGSRKQAACERPVIKASSTDENRPATTCLNIANHRRAFARISCRRIFFGWIGDVDQMVPDALLFVCRDLVGPDIEASIDRRRITADDFTVVPCGELKRETALSRSRRTENGNKGIHAFVVRLKPDATPGT